MTWKRTRPLRSVCMFNKQSLGILTLLLGLLEEEMALTLPSHKAAVETEAIGEVGEGGLLRPVVQAVDGGFLLGRIIVRNLGAYGWLAVGS